MKSDTSSSATTRLASIKILRTIGDFFGALPSGLTEEDLIAPHKVVQLGRAPIRIDLLSGVSGAEFASAWKRRVKGKFGAVDVHYVSLDDLIVMKRAAGRDQDIADVAALLRAKDSLAHKRRPTRRG